MLHPPPKKCPATEREAQRVNTRLHEMQYRPASLTATPSRRQGIPPCSTPLTSKTFSPPSSAGGLIRNALPLATSTCTSRGAAMPAHCPISKDVLLILDHVGNCIDHGLPTSPRQWSLRGVEKPPGPALQWRCPAPDCGCINDMADLFCAGCGEPRPAGVRKPPRHVAGELAELTAERFAAMRRMSFHEMASKTRTEAELQEFASARGYHRGWVWHRLQEQEQPGMKP